MVEEVDTSGPRNGNGLFMQYIPIRTKVIDVSTGKVIEEKTKNITPKYTSALGGVLDINYYQELNDNLTKELTSITPQQVQTYLEADYAWFNIRRRRARSNL